MPREPKPLQPLKLEPLIPLDKLREVVRRMIDAPKPETKKAKPRAKKPT